MYEGHFINTVYFELAMLTIFLHYLSRHLVHISPKNETTHFLQNIPWPLLLGNWFWENLNKYFCRDFFSNFVTLNINSCELLAILTIAMKNFQSDSQYISFAKTSDSPPRYTRHETTHIFFNYTIFCAKLKCLTSWLHLGFRSVLCEKIYWMADIK